MNRIYHRPATNSTSCTSTIRSLLNRIGKASLFSAMILPLGISACSTTQTKPELELTESNKSNEAVVYFYRPKLSLSGLEERNPPNIYINQELIGKLPNGSFKSTIIKELENKTISVLKTINDRSYSGIILQQDVDISGATRYFIKLQYNQKNKPELMLVSEAIAKQEMSKLKSMEAKDE